MKTIPTAVAVALIAFITGYWLGQQQTVHSEGSAASASNEREVLYYKAPMDPNYRRDEPGKSPMGMDLVPVYADEAGGMAEGAVRISPTVVNNLGVRTAAVQQGALAREIDTVGYIGYDEATLHKISTRVDGWIEQLNISASGDPVTKGQTLFELYSPMLVNAQEEYLVALQSRNTGLHKASRERLVALGISGAEINRLSEQRTVRQRIKILAPTTGVVAHLGVREGQYVSATSDIMSIGSLDNVWLLAEVFERQSGWLAKGQTAVVSLDALGGATRAGLVDYVYPELNQKTRTLTARIRLDNADQALKPNMFARARIRAQAISDALHVPQEALIRGGRSDRVVLVNDDGSFRSQPVTVGIEAKDRVQITSGLAVGDEVVTSGQFLIDSESNIDSALSRMNAEPAEQPMAISEETTDAAAVMATIIAVDPDARALTLKHGAIDAWSMPGMTMVFEVTPEIDLAAVDTGMSAHVQIKRHSSGLFVVTALHAMPAMDTPEADQHEGHDMNKPAPDPHAGHNISGHDMTDMPTDVPNREEAEEQDEHRP